MSEVGGRAADLKEVRDHLIKLLSCSHYMEEAVAQILKSLSEVVPEDSSLVLRYVAQESLNHRDFVEGVMSLLGIELMGEEACRHVGGEAYRVIKEALRKVKSVRDVREAAEILKAISDFEELVGEEFYVCVSMPFLKFYISDLGGAKAFAHLGRVAELIAEEELHHAKILKEVARRLGAREVGEV